MTTEEGLLREVIDHPHDPAARLIYADWLEEHGDPRAEFLRLEVALGEMPEDDARYADSFARLRSLWTTLDRDWLAQVSRSPVEGCQFRFRCPKKWEQLKVTEEPAVRMCDTCKREVLYCKSIPEARRFIQLGCCVAVDARVERREGDLPEEEYSEVMTLGDMAFDDDSESVTVGMFGDDEDVVVEEEVEGAERPRKAWWRRLMFWA
jgi:uncharacterized protein (TIGR02996 family)